MQSQILQLDIQGTPQAWISPEQAALHLSTDDVAWAVGESDPLTVLRGGYGIYYTPEISNSWTTLTLNPPIVGPHGDLRDRRSGTWTVGRAGGGCRRHPEPG